jgi:hypothetical protein
MQKGFIEPFYATEVKEKKAKRSRRGVLCDQCEWE